MKRLIYVFSLYFPESLGALKKKNLLNIFKSVMLFSGAVSTLLNATNGSVCNFLIKAIPKPLFYISLIGPK